MDIVQANIEAHDARALHAYRSRPAPERGDGCCISCGDTIPPERLKAVPHAKRCVVCQSVVEKC